MCISRYNLNTKKSLNSYITIAINSQTKSDYRSLKIANKNNLKPLNSLLVSFFFYLTHPYLLYSCTHLSFLRSLSSDFILFFFNSAWECSLIF